MILFGVPEAKKTITDKESALQEKEVILKDVGLEGMDFDYATRLGRFQAGKTRPLLVKFVRLKDKIVFQIKSNSKITKMLISEWCKKKQKGKEKYEK